MSCQETWMSKVTRRTFVVRWHPNDEVIGMKCDIAKVPDKAKLTDTETEDDGSIVFTFVLEIEDYSGNTRSPSEGE